MNGGMEGGREGERERERTGDCNLEDTKWRSLIGSFTTVFAKAKGNWELPTRYL